MAPRGGFTVTVALLAIAAMGVCLATLLWLEEQFERAVESDINRAVQFFAGSGALGAPHRREGVRYVQLRAVVEANRRGFIRDIWVTKELDDGSEHLLWPLVAWRTAPDWRERVAGWQRRSLVDARGEEYGHIHFDIDPTVIRSTAWAARGVGVLLVAAIVSLLLRLFGTSQRLEQTTGALMERQRELIHLERLALAGQLSANVLHDLKKPVLNVRHGLADLREALGEFAGVRRALEELEGQTDLFQSILRETNLERFVQARDADREYLDVNAVLRQALGLVRYERGDVEVHLDLDESIPAVHGSPHRLVQVFSNLILNAYQAMGGRGRLEVRTAAADGGVRVEIADSGPGLAPEVRGRLFEPFVTTKTAEAGAGLGLVICRLIVEEMGGTIAAADNPGGGALFRVSLPGGAHG